MTDHHEPEGGTRGPAADSARTNDRAGQDDSTGQHNSTGQDDSAAMNQGMRVLSHLIAGVLLYGALGWLGDHYLSTSFLLPVGIVLGAALAVYTAVRRLSVQLDAAPARSDRRAISTEQKGKGQR